MLPWIKFLPESKLGLHFFFMVLGVWPLGLSEFHSCCYFCCISYTSHCLAVCQSPGTLIRPMWASHSLDWNSVASVLLFWCFWAEEAVKWRKFGSDWSLLCLQVACKSHILCCAQINLIPQWKLGKVFSSQSVWL